ncbi:MAG TPA: hypothetical protein VFB06_05390 [Streptosporangiaceae bacterium]|nr:hypothetical protein [Streptosporangiaceae bacterium]
MSHAARMIVEAQAQREKALAEGDTAEARRCETQIARWRQVKADVDAAPPLSGAVRDKLSILLRPVSSEPAPLPRRAAQRAA